MSVNVRYFLEKDFDTPLVYMRRKAQKHKKDFWVPNSQLKWFSIVDTTTGELIEGWHVPEWLVEKDNNIKNHSRIAQATYDSNKIKPKKDWKLLQHGGKKWPLN